MTAIIEEFPTAFRNLSVIVNGASFKAYSNSFSFNAAIYGLAKKDVETIHLEIVGAEDYGPAVYVFDAASVSDLPNLKSLSMDSRFAISDASLLPKSLVSLTCGFGQDETLDLPNLDILDAYTESPSSVVVDATKCPLLAGKDLGGFGVHVLTAK